jgi:hypothetical protein
LIGAGYGIILSERYELAEEIHRFACQGLPRHFSDENKKIMIVNYANSLNLQKRHEEAASIIDAHDWSASDSKFRISVAAVKNDSARVGLLIKEIGSNGSVTESDYQEWPVFKSVRETECFRKAYEDVFGKQFEPLIPTIKVNVSHFKETLSHWVGLDKIKKEHLPGIIQASMHRINEQPGETRDEDSNAST